MPATLEELCDAPDIVLRVIRVRRPHQNVNQAHKRRIQRFATLVQVVVGKDRAIMLGNGANDRILGQIGLDNDLARAIAAPGTAGDLLQSRH